MAKKSFAWSNGIAPRIANPKEHEFFAMSSDQRERVEINRAAARIGWRPSRPVLLTQK
jgi:hypothetical protein